MRPISHVIFEVDEEAAFRTEGGLYKPANLGMVQDHMTEWGVVLAAPPESELEKGDKIWFSYILKDTKEVLSEKTYNWDFKELSSKKVYVCPKRLYDITWRLGIIAKEKDGKYIPMYDRTVGEKVVKEKSRFEITETIEHNLVKELYTDRILIKKKDHDYPINVKDNLTLEFIENENILGEMIDGVPVPKEGVTFLRPQDEGEYKKKGLIFVLEKDSSIKGHGVVIDTTHKELKKGDDVIYEKSKYSRVEINGIDPFYAVSNDKILVIL